MSEQSPGQDEMPPSHLNAKELAEWWRKRVGGKYDTTGDNERICPYCQAINPCTGIDECIQCQHSLKGARRTKSDHRHTSEYY